MLLHELQHLQPGQRLAAPAGDDPGIEPGGARRQLRGALFDRVPHRSRQSGRPGVHGPKVGLQLFPEIGGGEIFLARQEQTR